MRKVCNLKLINQGDYFLPKIHLFGMTHKFRFAKFLPVIKFYWRETFEKYFKENDSKEKIKNLKDGMDETSCDYIDHFIKLFSYINKPYFGNLWTREDKKLKKECKEFEKTFRQPFRDILKIDPFYYSNIYGLKDLYEEVFDKINGKIIIDGGALNGDSALMFHYYFPKSEIHAYEPLSVNYSVMDKFLKIDNCNNKIIPIKEGLGQKEEVVEITFNDREMAQITTIDSNYKNSETIGLIKLDTEGFESAVIEGAKEIIKRDKPIVIAAIYHTPEDFFELKEKLKMLNPDYKFMVRRSEMVIPMADLVLIAY